MRCPNCGFAIDQPVIAEDTDPGASTRRCILCNRLQRECGRMVVGTGGGVCVDCVLLSMEMINNPDKYGPAVEDKV